MSSVALMPADSPAPVRGPDARTRCDAWYGAHGRAIYRYLRFHVDSADTAEDLAADVFLRAFEAADRFDPERAEAKVWLFGIARNALRDHFRRQRVRRHVDVAALRDVAVEAPSPEERLLHEEAVARLLDGVARLSDADRELVSLRYGSELSPAEMAGVLGMREPVVRTRLWRALGRLRTLLAAEGA